MDPKTSPQSALQATADDTPVQLGELLAQIPEVLGCGERAFPLLTALQNLPGYGVETARRLLLVAASIHVGADERRTAEYVLRHRHEVTSGARTSRSLIRAARCAAEMDCRRVHLIEVPTGEPHGSDSHVLSAVDSPSVAEAVASYLADAIGSPLEGPSLDALTTGVLIALEVAERHRLNGGRGMAPLAMRSDARVEARLVTHLRRDAATERCAAPLARLLVGSDRTAVETGLLWWVAMGRSSLADVSAAIREKWAFEISKVEQAVQLSTGAGDFAHRTYRAS